MRTLQLSSSSRRLFCPEWHQKWCRWTQENHQMSMSFQNVVILEYTFAKREICVRWMRQKNRPRGSLLARKCSCGIQGVQHCLVHRMQKLMMNNDPGEGTRLFKWSGPHILAKLRKCLRLLKVPFAGEFTLKAFRAGKATQMAAYGITRNKMCDIQFETRIEQMRECHFR